MIKGLVSAVDVSFLPNLVLLNSVDLLYNIAFQNFLPSEKHHQSMSESEKAIIKPEVCMTLL